MSGVGRRRRIAASAATVAALFARPAPAQDELRPHPRWLLQGMHGGAVSSDDFRERFQLVAYPPRGWRRYAWMAAISSSRSTARCALE